MDIRYTILGFLDWKPLSGYDLKKLIARSDLFYWSGNNNQIYTALIQLHKEELVTLQVELQENLPARKIYTITEKGRAEFHRWLFSAPELPEIQNNFLIQLAWADCLSEPELDGLLERYEGEIAVQMKMREAQAERAGDHPGRTPREKFLWRRIDENLIEVFQKELDWIRLLRGQLREKIFE
ncbi:MAG: PadR family transcriptional regulator [Anaerolineaceae bacterium]